VAGAIGGTGGEVDVIMWVVVSVEVDGITGVTMRVESVGPVIRGVVVMMRGTGVFEDTFVSGVTVVGSIGAAIGDAAVVTVEVVVIAAMVVIT